MALVSVRASLGLFRLPPAPMLAVGLLPGALQYLASVLYTRALLRTDAATVAAINQTAPLFSVVWGMGRLRGGFRAARLSRHHRERPVLRLVD